MVSEGGGDNVLPNTSSTREQHPPTACHCDLTSAPTAEHPRDDVSTTHRSQLSYQLFAVAGQPGLPHGYTRLQLLGHPFYLQAICAILLEH
jgi:hypothetical protein